MTTMRAKRIGWTAAALIGSIGSIGSIGLMAGPVASETLGISSIPVPEGCVRKSFADGTFSHWLQSLPLKKDNRISAYDGSKIPAGQFNVLAVLSMPLLFKSDLEQCADFCMRLWGEYHRQSNAMDRFYLFDYNGKRKGFAASRLSYPAFMKRSFSNANSHSLKKGSAPVKEADLIPGDMFVQNDDGGIGHVSMIMDMCTDAKGKNFYLIGFSFMPAQEFHLEKPAVGQGRGGWFTVTGFNDYLAANFAFGKPVLRRFQP